VGTETDDGPGSAGRASGGARRPDSHGQVSPRVLHSGACMPASALLAGCCMLLLLQTATPSANGVSHEAPSALDAVGSRNPLTSNNDTMASMGLTRGALARQRLGLLDFRSLAPTNTPHTSEPTAHTHIRFGGVSSRPDGNQEGEPVTVAADKLKKKKVASALVGSTSEEGGAGGPGRSSNGGRHGHSTKAAMQATTAVAQASGKYLTVNPSTSTSPPAAGTMSQTDTHSTIRTSFGATPSSSGYTRPRVSTASAPRGAFEPVAACDHRSAGPFVLRAGRLPDAHLPKDNRLGKDMYQRLERYDQWRLVEFAEHDAALEEKLRGADGDADASDLEDHDSVYSYDDDCFAALSEHGDAANADCGEECA
jgi:hypothetical protein